MDTGIGFFATHDAIGPAALARLVEEHGHAALYFAEHSHIPASRASPYSGGGELPRKYAHTYDLFVNLTAAATATTRLRIGSGICLVTERDPIHTAKAIASVDRLSGGRMEFGVGAGWNREEMANHGKEYPYTVRARATRRRLPRGQPARTSGGDLRSPSGSARAHPRRQTSGHARRQRAPRRRRRALGRRRHARPGAHDGPSAVTCHRPPMYARMDTICHAVARATGCHINERPPSIASPRNPGMSRQWPAKPVASEKDVAAPPRP